VDLELELHAQRPGDLPMSNVYATSLLRRKCNGNELPILYRGTLTRAELTAALLLWRVLKPTIRAMLTSRCVTGNLTGSETTARELPVTIGAPERRNEHRSARSEPKATPAH
jgi:hypothetical protein